MANCCDISVRIYAEDTTKLYDYLEKFEKGSNFCLPDNNSFYVLDSHISNGGDNVSIVGWVKWHVKEDLLKDFVVFLSALDVGYRGLVVGYCEEGCLIYGEYDVDGGDIIDTYVAEKDYPDLPKELEDLDNYDDPRVIHWYEEVRPSLLEEICSKKGTQNEMQVKLFKELKEEILEKCDKALARAIDKHPYYPTKVEDTLPILVEEVGEVAKALGDGEGMDRVEEELLDIVAVAYRALINIQRYRDKSVPEKRW